MWLPLEFSICSTLIHYKRFFRIRVHFRQRYSSLKMKWKFVTWVCNVICYFHRLANHETPLFTVMRYAHRSMNPSFTLYIYHPAPHMFTFTVCCQYADTGSLGYSACWNIRAVQIALRLFSLKMKVIVIERSKINVPML